MQNDKLLPCPFCGYEAKSVKAHGIFEKPYVVVCENEKCRASVGMFSATKEEAIKHWNTRKPMERIVEQLEEKSSLNHLEKMEERVGKKQTQGFGLGIRCAIDIVKGGVDNG
mgnify:CR=1 FL=1